jgi:hypothetical protein
MSPHPTEFREKLELGKRGSDVDLERLGSGTYSLALLLDHVSSSAIRNQANDIFHISIDTSTHCAERRISIATTAMNQGTRSALRSPT